MIVFFFLFTKFDVMRILLPLVPSRHLERSPPPIGRTSSLSSPDCFLRSEEETASGAATTRVLQIFLHSHSCLIVAPGHLLR